MFRSTRRRVAAVLRRGVIVVEDGNCSGPKMEARLAVESRLIVFEVFDTGIVVVESIWDELGQGPGWLVTGTVGAAVNDGGLVEKNDCRFLGVKAPDDAPPPIPVSSDISKLDFGHAAAGES